MPCHIQAVTAALLLFCFGAAGPVPRAQGAVEADTVSIYLIRFGWHADLAIPVGPCDPVPTPEAAGMRTATHLVVGWGDAKYFPRADPGLATLLRAAAVPTSSVLYVRPVIRPISDVYPQQEILELRVSTEACEELGAFVRSHFVVDDGQIVPVPSTRNVAGTFYRSTDAYHLFNNCNHWVAEALAAAGLPIERRGMITVDRLWKAVEGFGSIVRPDTVGGATGAAP